MTNRKISLNFSGVQPIKLEENIIYISFITEQKKVIGAVAVSNEDFNYHPFSRNNNFSINVRKATTEVEFYGSSWHSPYDLFIEDIVKSNSGELDFSEIEEGFKIYRLLPKTLGLI